MLPSPEVLAHNESQGLDSREPSLEAISDVKPLLHFIAPTQTKKGRLLTDATTQELDNVNATLSILKTKLNSRPVLPASITITSSAVFHTIISICEVFNSVTKSSN